MLRMFDFLYTSNFLYETERNRRLFALLGSETPFPNIVLGNYYFTDEVLRKSKHSPLS